MVAVGCSSDVEKSFKGMNINTLKTVDINNSNLKDKFAIDTIIDKRSLKFIQLQTTENSTMGLVSSYFKTPEGLIIYDFNTKRIFLFNDHGTFLKTIGNYGRGHEEYLEPVDVKYNPFSKSMEVNDVSYKLTAYNVSSGKMAFAKDKFFFNSSGTMFLPIAKGKYALYNNFHAFEKDDLGFRFAIVSDKEKLYRALPFHSSAGIYEPISGGQFSEVGGEYHFFERFFPVVYQITGDSLRPMYRIKFAEGNLKATNPDNETAEQEVSRKKLPQLNSVIETRNFVFVDYSIGYIRQNSIFDKRRNVSFGASSEGYVIDELELPINTLIQSNALNELIAVIPANQIIACQARLRKKQNLSVLEKKVLQLQVTEFDNNLLLYFNTI
jgi:hypothetical protein